MELAPAVRVERTSSGLEAEALPLDDTGKMERVVRVELTSLGWKPRAFATKTKPAFSSPSLMARYLEERAGIEPAHYGFADRSGPISPTPSKCLAITDGRGIWQPFGELNPYDFWSQSPASYR